MKCNNFGLDFDESNLSEVIAHEHQITIIMEENIKGVKVIAHAMEVLPNASRSFQIGVNNALRGNYDERTLYQEDIDFRAGYWYAVSNMVGKYVLKSSIGS